jgi:hypothetical protein
MGAVISTVVGAVLGAVVVVGGVTTYQAMSIEDTQQVDPGAVGYADE